MWDVLFWSMFHWGRPLNGTYTLKNYVKYGIILALENSFSMCPKQIILKGCVNNVGKKQPKYTPLKLVEEHCVAIQKFEKERSLRTIEGAETEVEAAVPYAVDQAYAMNRIKPGQKLNAQQERIVLYESYDYAIATVIASYWQKCKQVYTFSREFYDMLLDMDDFEIGWSLYDYLPYETFYLELDGHEEIEGILVKYTKTPTRSILYTICSKNGKMHHINSGIVDPRKTGSYKQFFETEVYASNANMNAPEVVLVRQVLAFVLQACMYLCAKNADIEENPVQKNIYRPSTNIRNKFSEIRKWDVGVRVIKDHKAAKNAVALKPSDGEAARRRPRQHWRKAHWHTYWIGSREERTKVVKFIAPILVNDNNDDMPLIIHN